MLLLTNLTDSADDRRYPLLICDRNKVLQDTTYLRKTKNACSSIDKMEFQEPKGYSKGIKGKL